MTQLQPFADFPAEFRGPRFRPGEVGYSEARAIYNAITDHKQPALIARARDELDVITAVRYAADAGVPLAVRSGGHGVDGSVMPDGGLVLDMSALKTVVVDTAAGTARLGSGVLLGEMDRALVRYGLCVPAGTVSTTGVAGLTLGGGVGYNMRRLGATVDNLIACDVVTTDGRSVRASEDENPDLFWALRGGGGNFGIVTNFEFRASGIPSIVSAGFIPFALDQATEVMQGLREYMPSAPRELSVIGAFTHCPPLPPVPSAFHGAPVLMLVVVYTGPVDESDTVIRRLAALGDAAAVAVQPMPWPAANSMLDMIAPLGRRVYTKGAYLSTLSDDAVDIAIAHTASAPPDTAPPVPSTVQNFWALGGAISEDTAEGAMAFSREGASWFWEVATQWDDPAVDEVYRSWADGLHADLLPHVRSNCYVNLSTDQGPQWRRGVWGAPEKYQRLAEAKTKWDPENMLRANKNIEGVGIGSTV